MGRDRLRVSIDRIPEVRPKGGGGFASPLVAVWAAERVEGSEPRIGRIHPQDEMLQHLAEVHRGDQDQALVSYLQTGWSVFATLREVVQWRWGGFRNVLRLLDFASGYGRVTRFLVSELPDDRIWVADIQKEAVRFQEQEFGVQGLVSTGVPEDLAVEGRFDCVTVTSLFTHLPRERWQSWLKRLVGLVSPGGLMAFTVHDASLLSEWEIPPDGFLFRAISESKSLDLSEYGGTWVTPQFVSEAVADLGADLSVHRIPRGICNFQDLYIVVAEPAVDFSGLEVRADPFCYLERCFLTEDGRIEIGGWVCSGSRGRRVTEVQLEADGDLVDRCRDLGSRPDVAASLGRQECERSGWSCSFRPPEGTSRSSIVLLVRALFDDGGDALIVLRTLESALLWSAERELQIAKENLGVLRRDLASQDACFRQELASLKQQSEALRAAASAEVEALEARIAWMEASRFWKLRNGWHRLKSALAARCLTPARRR